MPFAENHNVRIHFDERGRGPAVLLVMGFGMTSGDWWRTVPVLARRFRVIVFDNRGAGLSDAPLGPYSTTQMAADAVAVLDAAGVDRAHVYGVSLGGMVAQEIALRSPERVRSLVLGATLPGGVKAHGPDRATLGFIARAAAMPDDEALWAAVPYTYAEETRRRHGDRIAEDIHRRLQSPGSAAASLSQAAAAIGHSTLGRLADLRAPTLIMHGEEDRIAHPANARLLAEAIPDARLRLWPRAGHLYMTDAPAADRFARRFMLRHSPEHGLIRRILPL